MHWVSRDVLFSLNFFLTYLTSFSQERNLKPSQT